MSNDVTIASTADAGSAGAAASPPGLSTDRREVLRHLRIIVQFAWLLPLIAFAVIAALLYRDQFSYAQQSIDRASRMAQEHALKLFETNAMLLQRMLDLWGDASDEEILSRGEEIHQKLKQMAADLPQVQGVFLNGADARALANNLVFPTPRNVDYSDREWFGVHRDGDIGVFFTEQLKSRISGEPFFDMSLRRTRSDGSFGGTAHVSLKPSYLTDFYAELARAEPGLRFGILRADGKFLARWPDPVPEGPQVRANAVFMQQISAAGPAATHHGDSPLDGVDRLRVFRQLSPYPLWVASSINKSDVIAQWLRRVGVLAAFVLPVTLMLAWMAGVALQRTRRELEAAQKLDHETALRQRMEVTLVQSQKLEALGRLTGGVAHDFNNLLMIVNNNLYVHRHLHPAICDSAQLGAIERAVAAGTKLTRQLLSFTRRQALKPERVDLKERLPVLLDLLAPVLGKTIELDVDIADDVPSIMVDFAELELALINLAVNAKDAMPDGGRLGVVVRAADARGPDEPRDGRRYVLLEVTDTGTGIAPENLKRAFEPFFTTKPIGRGTGLGLSQVQALCQAAGGAARITSPPGGGTCVALCFPALETEHSAGANATLVNVRQRLGCRLLLVEDNAAVAKASRDVLESMGCETEHVATAEAALARLAEPNAGFAIVVSDIEMPGAFDGIVLAERLAERYPRLPVVLMTGYAERLQEAVRRKFEVLPKPVAPNALAEAIVKALDRSHARAAA